MAAKKERIGIVSMTSTKASRDNGGAKNVTKHCRKALKSYDKYFLGKPKISVTEEGILIDFHMRYPFARSWNLELFEEVAEDMVESIAEDMVESISEELKKANINVELWSASGTDFYFLFKN